MDGNRLDQFSRLEHPPKLNHIGSMELPVELDSGLAQRKMALRARLKAELRAVAPQVRVALSEQAAVRLLEQPVWQRARTVLLFRRIGVVLRDLRCPGPGQDGCAAAF